MRPCLNCGKIPDKKTSRISVEWDCVWYECGCGNQGAEMHYPHTPQNKKSATWDAEENWDVYMEPEE